jgi:hypothetical protein
MTIKELCFIADLKREFVETALDIEDLRNKISLPQKERKQENSQADLLRTFGLIEGIMYSYKPKTIQKVGHRQPTIYKLPSSTELNKTLGIEYPTYITVRLDTYLRYKADISQFLSVVTPGRLSYGEIARAAGVSYNTARRHEVIAETQVVRKYANVKMSEWNVDALPEDYQDYIEHDKKYKFRGAWLEYKGIKEPYAKTGYQKHLLRGGTKDTILVRWNKKGDHFVRDDLVVERPIDEREKEKFARTSKAVYDERITLEQANQMFPGLFSPRTTKPNIPPPMKGQGLPTHES